MNRLRSIIPISFFGMLFIASSLYPTEKLQYRVTSVIGNYKVTVFSHKPIELAQLLETTVQPDTLEELWRLTKSRLAKSFPKEEMVWTISYAKPLVKSAACNGSIDSSLTVTATNMNHTEGQSYFYQYPADAVKCDVDVDQGSYDVYKRIASGQWVLVRHGETDYHEVSETAGNGSPVTRGCKVVALSGTNKVSVFLTFLISI